MDPAPKWNIEVCNRRNFVAACSVDLDTQF